MPSGHVGGSGQAAERPAGAVPDASISAADATGPPMRLVDAFSRGSKNHHRGQCTPCRSNEIGVPCPRGAACDCCHYHHGPEKWLAMGRFAMERQRLSAGADPDGGRRPTAPAAVGEAPGPRQREPPRQDEAARAAGGPAAHPRGSPAAGPASPGAQEEDRGPARESVVESARAALRELTDALAANGPSVEGRGDGGPGGRPGPSARRGLPLSQLGPRQLETMLWEVAPDYYDD